MEKGKKGRGKKEENMEIGSKINIGPLTAKITAMNFFLNSGWGEFFF